MKHFHLPKRIRLPGFVIRIEEVTMTEPDMAEWVYGDNGGVIRIQKGLPQGLQSYYFSHEMLHAMIDYHHKQVKEGGGP